MSVNEISDRFVDGLLKLSPETVTALGLPSDEWSDYSPAGVEREREFIASTLRELEGAEPVSADEAVTKAAMLDRLGVSLAALDLGEPFRALNNIASPIQAVRDTLTQMETGSEQGRHNLARRIETIGDAYSGYAKTLSEGVSRGLVPARRQVKLGIEQLEQLASPDSLLDDLGAQAGASDEQVRAGKDAALELASFLRNELAPHALEGDSVGRERYEVASHAFVGHKIDLDETYEWGLAELESIIAEQRQCAENLYGRGVGVQEAIDRLNADPQYAIDGTDNLQAWMQRTADSVIDRMDGVHFDIPEQIRRIDCRIERAGTGGIYYMGPSEDFTRAGRMCWDVPQGETHFVTWQELTTVYHEGVPGHHLQIGQAMVESEHLNRWRRSFAFNSGHAEGWALYAERLMDELGFFPDEGFRMGLLDGQRLRAARVVLDIGVHLGKQRPDGKGAWDADYAWQFMRENVAMSDAFLRFEVNRYLGWPGQAPSYKVGQRLWQQMRDDFLVKRPGELKEFHRLALREGGLPLGVLRDVVLAQA